jgi:hypothetical protein
MSSNNEPPDKHMPVLKDKNPHNYRKVGFCMIIISVSLVIIALLVWSIGSNYHFASDIMAGQEVTAMTPKAGYQIILFDYTQPVGAKLKLLDHTDSLDAAQKLQSQYAQQNTVPTGQVIIFGTSEPDNVNTLANAEVAELTPQQGYNVILYNTALPVGARLTMGIHEDSLDNATQYEQGQASLIADPDVKVILFTSSFTDNLKLVTGSSIPAPAFAALANETASVSQPTGNQTIQTTAPGATTVIQPTVTPTSLNVEKTSINATVSAIVSNPSSNQIKTVNTTASKSITVNETVNLNTETSNK